MTEKTPKYPDLPLLDDIGRFIISSSAAELNSSIQTMLTQLDVLYAKLKPDKDDAISVMLSALYQQLFIQARQARQLERIRHISDINSGSEALVNKPCDAVKLYKDVIADCEAILKQRHVAFVFEEAEDALVSGFAYASIESDMIEDALYRMLFFIMKNLLAVSDRKKDSNEIRAGVKLSDGSNSEEPCLVYYMTVDHPLPLTDTESLAFVGPIPYDNIQNTPSIFIDNLSTGYYAATLHGGRLLRDEIKDSFGNVIGHRLMFSFPINLASGSLREAHGMPGYVVTHSLPRALVEMSPLIENFLEMYNPLTGEPRLQCGE